MARVTLKRLEEINEQISDEKSKLEEELNAAKAATIVALKKISRLEEQASSSSGSSNSSGSDSRGVGTVTTKLNLNFGKKCNLTTHVKTHLYRDLKFINDATLTAYPGILDVALVAMGVVSVVEKAQYGEATKKELKYILSQRRNYSKKMIMTKYNGKLRRSWMVIQRGSCSHCSFPLLLLLLLLLLLPQTGGVKYLLGRIVLDIATLPGSEWGNMKMRIRTCRPSGALSCSTFSPISALLT